MSSVLAAKGIITNCSHRFVFATGSGNGIGCAIGKGRHLLPTTLSTNIARLIENLADYSGEDAARMFATNLLQTSSGKQGSFAGFLTRSYPDSGFANEGKFRSWWDDTKQVLANLGMPSE